MFDKCTDWHLWSVSLLLFLNFPRPGLKIKSYFILLIMCIQDMTTLFPLSLWPLAFLFRDLVTEYRGSKPYRHSNTNMLLTVVKHMDVHRYVKLKFPYLQAYREVRTDTEIRIPVPQCDYLSVFHFIQIDRTHMWRGSFVSEEHVGCKYFSTYSKRCNIWFHEIWKGQNGLYISSRHWGLVSGRICELARRWLFFWACSYI